MQKFGISSEAETVYFAMIANPDSDIEELARQIGSSRSCTHLPMARLAAL